MHEIGTSRIGFLLLCFPAVLPAVLPQTHSKRAACNVLLPMHVWCSAALHSCPVACMRAGAAEAFVGVLMAAGGHNTSIHRLKSSMLFKTGPAAAAALCNFVQCGPVQRLPLPSVALRYSCEHVCHSRISQHCCGALACASLLPQAPWAVFKSAFGWVDTCKLYNSFPPLY